MGNCHQSPNALDAIRAGSSRRVRLRRFRWYMLARFLTTISSEMQSVAVGWQVVRADAPAARSRPCRPGSISSRHPAIPVGWSRGGQNSASIHSAGLLCRVFPVLALLFALTFHGLASAYPIYLVLLLNGAVRAFNGPACASIFAAAGFGRTLSQCRGMERLYLSDRHNCRSDDWWIALRLEREPGTRLFIRGNSLSDRIGFVVASSNKN